MGCNDIKCKKNTNINANLNLNRFLKLCCFPEFKPNYRIKKILQFDRFKARETHFLSTIQILIFYYSSLNF